MCYRYPSIYQAYTPYEPMYFEKKNFFLQYDMGEDLKFLETRVLVQLHVDQ